MPYDKVEDLPITHYMLLLNQAFNLSNVYRQGAVELQTPEDKLKQLKQERAFFKIVPDDFEDNVEITK